MKKPVKKSTTTLESKLRTLVYEELRQCSSSVTPAICSRISTPDGYLQIEEMVIDFCLKNNLTPSAAIVQLESELE